MPANATNEMKEKRFKQNTEARRSQCDAKGVPCSAPSTSRNQLIMPGNPSDVLFGVRAALGIGVGFAAFRGVRR
jgi:hypothetical protein